LPPLHKAISFSANFTRLSVSHQRNLINNHYCAINYRAARSKRLLAGPRGFEPLFFGFLPH
jgi:hypothetical protein